MFSFQFIFISVNPVKRLKDAMESIITTALDGQTPSDPMGITLCSQDFNRGEEYISFKTAYTITFNDIWDLVSSVYQFIQLRSHLCENVIRQT